MANPEIKKDNGTNKGEGTQEEEQNQNTEMVAVKQKSGIGTALKIGGGLLITAALTGLGWMLRGIFEGRDEDDETENTESTEPTEN